MTSHDPSSRGPSRPVEGSPSSEPVSSTQIKRITVTRRSQDYHAQLDGTALWGCDATPRDAVGGLLVAHYDHFGIAVKWHDGSTTANYPKPEAPKIAPDADLVELAVEAANHDMADHYQRCEAVTAFIDLFAEVERRAVRKCAAVAREKADRLRSPGYKHAFSDAANTVDDVEAQILALIGEAKL